MRVQGDAVGTLGPAEPRTPALRQLEESAVGGVDVEPETLALRDVGDLGERIDRAGVRRARRPDHEERTPPGRAIGARTMRPSSSGSIRSSASDGTIRSASGPKPAIIAAFVLDPWA